MSAKPETARLWLLRTRGMTHEEREHALEARDAETRWRAMEEAILTCYMKTLPSRGPAGDNACLSCCETLGQLYLGWGTGPGTLTGANLPELDALIERAATQPAREAGEEKGTSK